jgi:hypothetical protein
MRIRRKARVARLDFGALVVAGGFLPSPAARLGDALEVTVALRWRCRRFVAQHRCAAWRWNHHCRIGVTLGDIGVNAILVIGGISGD